jgi:hypothetical protein
MRREAAPVDRGWFLLRNGGTGTSCGSTAKGYGFAQPGGRHMLGRSRRTEIESQPSWFTAALAQTPEHFDVEVQGCRIHWRAWGNPDRPPLVLVHGIARGADASARTVRDILHRGVRARHLNVRLRMRPYIFQSRLFVDQSGEYNQSSRQPAEPGVVTRLLNTHSHQ